jgi:hypothetical protein
MSLKNSNDTIGNRTRELPVCSHRPPPRHCIIEAKNTVFVTRSSRTFAHSGVFITPHEDSDLSLLGKM